MIQKEYYYHLDFLCNQYVYTFFLISNVNSYVYTFYSMLHDEMYTLTNNVIYAIEPNAENQIIYMLLVINNIGQVQSSDKSETQARVVYG
jgi:hypothetical protein